MTTTTTTTANIPSTSAQPYAASIFSFTAPFPPPSSPPLSAAAASASAKQRRVSLALALRLLPCIFPAWSFRDDTGLGVHSPDSAQATDDAADAKKGKIRRIAGGNGAADAGDMTMNMSHGSCGHQPPSTMNSEKPEKKPRKKWTMEETQMLVAGCNKVRRRSRLRSLSNEC